MTLAKEALVPRGWRALLGAVVSAVLAVTAGAQAPPATDIFLAHLDLSSTPPALGPSRAVTDRDGYDNQPSFLSDGSALRYTSILDGQAEIMAYRLSDGSQRRLTETPESEYSPTSLPDGGGFSVVRVEGDGTQRLWAFAADGSEPRLLLRDVAPVGYHAWIDSATVALFVLGEPPTLQLGDLASGAARPLVADIGRSLHRGLGGEITFVSRSEDGSHWIESLRPTTGQRARLHRAVDGSQDFAWTPDGRLLMAQAATIYLAQPRPDAPWEPLADLASAGLSGITRLAVSPDGSWLAFVADRPSAKGDDPAP